VPHVFVESNWLFDYAAPAHHQSPAAVELLERAQRGDFTLHLPNCCLGEARNAILTKCRPRNEANAIRGFLAHAESGGHISKGDAAVVRTVLNQYVLGIKRELENLDSKLKVLAELPYVRIFGLDDAMLTRATELALVGITLKPYDQAILGGVLVNAERLWNSGERLLAFCETDADLQPWDKEGHSKTQLRDAYDKAHVWVYENFTLTVPPRRPGFE
jgi:hypothetical protein